MDSTFVMDEEDWKEEETYFKRDKHGHTQNHIPITGLVDLSLLDTVKALQNGILTEDRNGTFSGSQLCECVVLKIRNLIGEDLNKKQAVYFGQLLLDMKLIQPVETFKPFEDDKSLYKWGEQQFRQFTIEQLKEIIQQLKLVLDVKDRTYMLKKHKNCFIASEFIDALIKMKIVNSRADSLNIGQSMVNYGLLCHVTNAHAFRDGYFFFRFKSENTDESHISDLQAVQNLYNKMKSGVEIKDRKWRLRTFKECFIGEEAVNWLVLNGFAASREEAVLHGRDLMSLGLLRHVSDDQDFHDGHYFYRFIDENKLQRSLSSKDFEDGSYESELKFDAMVLKFASGMSIKNRIYNVTEYKKVFIGEEAVTWICENYQISRDKAVEWGQKLFDRGVFHHCVKEHQFKDKLLYYRLQMDERDRVLNIAKIWKSETRNAVYVSQNLLSQITRIYYKFIINTMDFEKIRISYEYRSFVLQTSELQAVNLMFLSQVEKKVFWINTFHTLLLHALIAMGAPKNLFQRKMFFDTASYRIGSENYSLDDISFGILLGNTIRPGVYRIPHDSPKIREVISNTGTAIFSALSFGTLRSPKIHIYHPKDFYRTLSHVTANHLNLQTKIEPDHKRLVIPKEIIYKIEDEDIIEWINSSLIPSVDEEKRENILNKNLFKVKLSPPDFTSFLSKNEPIDEKINLMIPESVRQKDSIKVEECEMIGDWVVRKYSDGLLCLDNYEDPSLSLSKATDNCLCHKFSDPWLVYSSKSGITIFDVHSKNEKKVQEFKEDTSQAHKILINHEVVIAATPSKLRIWKLADGSQVKTVNLRSCSASFLQNITTFDYFGDFKTVILGTRQSIQIWNIESEILVHEGKSDLSDLVSFTAIQYKFPTIAAATSELELKVWKFDEKRMTVKQEVTPLVAKIQTIASAVYLDEKHVIISQLDGLISVFNLDERLIFSHDVNVAAEKFELQISSSKEQKLSHRSLRVAKFDRYVVNATRDCIYFWDIYASKANQAVFCNSLPSTVVCPFLISHDSIIATVRTLEPGQFAVIQYNPIPFLLSKYIDLPTSL